MSARTNQIVQWSEGKVHRSVGIGVCLAGGAVAAKCVVVGKWCSY